MEGAQIAAGARAAEVLRVAQVEARAPDAVTRLAAELGDGPFALVCLFVAPDADFAALTRAAARRFGAAEVLACSTAGEIGRNGYEDGQIIALGFPDALFAARSHAIEGLDRIDEIRVADRLVEERMSLTGAAPGMEYEFAFLLADGLSMREEQLAAMLAAGLGPIPLFGGSAGDGTRFRRTRLSRNGREVEGGALVALLRSHCPVRVFSFDHLHPTGTRMVVTAADPERRVVREINAEPAAREYARLLGKDPGQLDPFTFAAHPVVVRLGDSHHVRAIQRVNEAGELQFFSAINEGMVLTLATPGDMAEHLEGALASLDGPDAPARILACDCVLRKIEARQTQRTRAVSEILARHRVVGFSTYGEQHGALHVNQTLTGVALYPPAQT
ncbi:FIST N-terminal domain-containing protein [Roseivivax sp. CAU 1761]